MCYTAMPGFQNFGAAKVVLSLEAVKTFSTSQTSVPYTASQSSPPPGSSETVKTFDWESRWNLLLSNWIPTWTQPPAAPPCDGFNCNKPGYSSDAEKSDEEDEGKGTQSFSFWQPVCLLFLDASHRLEAHFLFCI